MSEAQRVITEIWIDASGSVAGAAQSVRAHREAELAANKLSDTEEKARRAREKGVASFAGVSSSIARVRNEYANLQARMDPVFAAQIRNQREMEKAVLLTDAAVRRGVTSEIDAANTISRLRQQQLRDLQRLKDATQDVVRVQRAANDNLNTANIAAQFQDIAVTSAMGMSPLQIALQQGTQLSAAFGTNGAAGAVKALGAAFVSILSPISLVTIGLVAGTAALIQYFSTGEEEAKSLDKALEAHAETIRALKEAYGEAASGLQEYVSRSRVVADAMAIIDAGRLETELRKTTDALVSSGEIVESEAQRIQRQIQDLMKAFELEGDAGRRLEIDKQITALFQQLDGANTVAKSAAAGFEPLAAALDKFAASAREGAPDYIRLKEEVSKQLVLQPTNDGLRELADRLFGIIDPGVRAQSALKATEIALDEVHVQAGTTTSSVESLTAAISAFNSAVQSMSGIAAPLDDSERAAQALTKALQAAGSDIILRQEALKVYADAMDRIRDKAALDKETKAAEEFANALDQVRSRADGLGEKLFPGEYALREAKQLQAELDLYGDKLDDVQRKAIEARIEDQFLAATLGVRELGTETDRTKNKVDELGKEGRAAAKELEDAFRDGLSGFLQDLFTGRDLLESIVDLGSRFASMNFDKLVDGLMGGSNGGGIFGGGGRPAQTSAPMTRGDFVTFAEVIGLKVADAVESAAANDNPGPVWERAGRSVAQGIVPTLEKGFSGQIQSFMSALKQIESSNNYGAVGPMTKYGRPLGAYQVLPENVTRWSQEFLGRAVTAGEWMKDAALQDKVVSAKLAQLAEKFPDMKDWAAIWNSGRPLSQSANIRDSVFGTRVGDYVNKVMGAYDPSSVGRAVETGAAKGTSEGTVDAWAGLREVTGPSAASPQQQQNGLGQNLMGGLSAALGGFSTGYQSANSGMGALGGFIQGFGATGNIFGGILGGIAGFIGGMLGAKKKLEEAKKNLERNMKAIDALLAVGEGRGIGENQKRITDYLTEIDKAVNLAWKAKEMDLVERLQESYNIMFVRLSKDFENAAAGTLRGYLGGRGREDPEMKGANAVFNLREELRNMIADFRFFGEKRLELSPNASAEERAAIIARTEAEVAHATAAARAMALAFLGGVEPMTEIQQAMGSIRGAADTLIPTLVELGMTQAEAAAAIESQVIVAVQKLRDEFNKGLDADINEANGKGYLNDFDDLFKALKDMRADAAAVGGDMEKVEAWYKSQAQSIIDGAQLIGPAFDQVIEAFPELEGVVTEFVDGIRSSSERLRDYEDRLYSATTDTSTLAGALAAFERDADRQREAERASAARDGIDLMVELERTLAAERLQIMEDFAERARQRILGFENRLFAATNDTSSLAGQLAAFDRAAAQERIEEIKAGGEGLAALDRALAAERLKIQKDYAKQAAEEEKRRYDEAKAFLEGWFRSLKEFVDSLRAGPESPLSPEARLAAAQSQFSRQYGKALTGDRDAANSLITYANNLLDAGRDRYASSTEFQEIWTDIIAKLEAIPDQVSAEQFIVNELTEAIEESATDIVTATDIMADTLAAAVMTGPRDTAAALSGFFERIDRTADGLLTFDEIKAALAGKATDAQIQSMMREIDLDANGMISRQESLLAAEGATRSAIVAAINGGPQSTAQLLATHFNRLDTSVNGLLDFNEMRAALGGVATDAQIRAMMSQLDTDMDGQISKLEMIKAATGQTQTNTAAVSADTVHLAHIRNNAREQMETSNILGGRRLNALNDIDRLQGGSGAFALGGRVSGPGTSTSDGIRAYLSDGEFVVRTRSAQSIGYGALDTLNRTGRLPVVPMPVAARNDNPGYTTMLLHQMEALRREVAELRQAQMEGNRIAAEGHARTGDATEETAARVKKSNTRANMAAERPRTAGTR